MEAVATKYDSFLPERTRNQGNGKLLGNATFT